MKHILASSLVFSLLVGSAAFAEAQQGHTMNREAMQKMDMAQMKAMPLTDGVAKKVDQKSGRITLQHGEVSNVKMPAMTMSYRVKQVQQLESIHAGDKVRFAMDMVGDDYIVTHIEAAK